MHRVCVCAHSIELMAHGECGWHAVSSGNGCRVHTTNRKIKIQTKAFITTRNERPNRSEPNERMAQKSVVRQCSVWNGCAQRKRRIPKILLPETHKTQIEDLMHRMPYVLCVCLYHHKFTSLSGECCRSRPTMNEHFVF